MCRKPWTLKRASFWTIGGPCSWCLRLPDITTRTFARDDNVETNLSKFGKASTIAWWLQLHSTFSGLVAFPQGILRNEKLLTVYLASSSRLLFISLSPLLPAFEDHRVTLGPFGWIVCAYPSEAAFLSFIPTYFILFTFIIPTMSAPGGTFRGTPNRTIGRGKMPDFDAYNSNSPSSSHLPRPKTDSAPTHGMSDAGSATTSASRQRQNQSKRDEVNHPRFLEALQLHATTPLRLIERTLFINSPLHILHIWRLIVRFHARLLGRSWKRIWTRRDIMFNGLVTPVRRHQAPF